MRNLEQLPQGETVPIPARSETDALIHMIERLARDPATDLVKLREILDFKREVQADMRREAYDRDYVRLQGLLDPVKMRGIIDIGVKGKGKQQRYAMFEDIHSAIREPMNVCGFGLTFRYADPEPGMIAVTTILVHRDGHREETTIPLPYDTTGSKNAVQSRGSSISYGRRYGVMGMLNLAATGEDDDGVKGGDGTFGPIDEQQLKEIDDLIVKSKANIPAFCDYMEVKQLADIPQNKYQEAIDALNAKIVKMAEKEKAAAQEQAHAGDANKDH